MTWAAPLDRRGALKARVEDLEAEGQTCVLVAVDGRLAGAISVRDELRPEVPEVVRTLRAQGVEVSMLTGDNARTAHALAQRAGIGDVHAELRPEDKARIVAQLSEASPTADDRRRHQRRSRPGRGDRGHRDGSDRLRRRDRVRRRRLHGHDLGLIPQALRHARRGRAIMNQNIVLSLAIITVLLPLAITGVLGLAAVVLVHEVAEVVVIAQRGCAPRVPASLRQRLMRAKDAVRGSTAPDRSWSRRTLLVAGTFLLGGLVVLVDQGTKGMG
ncbi:Copper-exporting P-type ATPase A [Rothia kristinae]|nr:Copper-exporting P-type ATPase A [Rothia kristinae]